MAKKFTFQQGFRHGGAIDLNKGHLSPLAVLDDGMRDDFLPGPAFALDQNGGMGLRHFFHHFENVLHEPAFSPNDGAAFRLHLLLLAEIGILALERLKRFESLQDEIQLRRQDRLDHVVEKTNPDGFQRRFHGGISGHENADRLGCELLELFQQLKSAAILQAQIGDHQIERVMSKRFLALLHRTHTERGVALRAEIINQHAAQIIVVIDY